MFGYFLKKCSLTFGKKNRSVTLKKIGKTCLITFQSFVWSLKKLFSPEFRNRLDEIIQFNYLPMKVILSIVDKFLTKLQAQLDARNVELIYSKKVLNWIAENGYSKEMGARPMERFITNQIKKPLVDKVLFGDLSKGGQIKVDLVSNKIKFSAKKKTALKHATMRSGAGG